MSDPVFNLPEANACLSTASTPETSAKTLLSQRRSTPVKLMKPDADGPDDATLKNIISTAMRVPDHRKLEPWRLLTIKGDARKKLGALLAERYAELNPDASDAALAEERNRPMRAPLCVTVISSPDHTHKTPVWEQELSAGALCMNLLYATHVAGFSASWISEWWAFDEKIDRALGLQTGERIAGHIFIGQASVRELAERPRPSFSNKVTEWG